MKKLFAFLLAAMLLLGLFTTAQAAAFEVYHHAITSLGIYSGYTASDWFSTAGNRAYIAAALYGETKDVFRSVVGTPAKIYIGKGLMNDYTTEFLVLDYFNSAGKFYTVTFYPTGTPQDPYAHAFYNDMSILSTSNVVNKYNPYYTITASAFSSAYSQWKSDGQSGGGDTKAFENYYHEITSLDSYSGYTASEWISTPEDRALAAAALYGETKEIFRKTVGNPTKVYVGKGLMNDKATEFLVLDYFNSSGKKFYTVTFYPEGTPQDPYAHAFYSDLSMMSSSYVASNYRPYYTISGDDFAKAYGKWKSGDYSGDDTYLFNFTGNSSSKKVSFTLPARGYIELNIDKSRTVCYDSNHGYYNILITKNGGQVMAINSFRYREETTEKYVIGLDRGSYEIQFKPGYSSYETIRDRINGTFTPDNFYEIETNNTMGQATELQLDAAYTGYFGDEQDNKEYYSFWAQQGKRYQIRFPNMAALERTTAITDLIDSRGQDVGMRLSETRDYFYYDFIPERTGTYYIKIYNYTEATYGVVRYQVGVFGGYADGLPGDVNDDGIVDGRDVLRLMKYLAGEEEDEKTGEPLKINFDNADVDGSGSINEKDLLRLMRYLGGEDVKLLPGAMSGNG